MSLSHSPHPIVHWFSIIANELDPRSAPRLAHPLDDHDVHTLRQTRGEEIQDVPGDIQRRIWLGTGTFFKFLAGFTIDQINL